MAFFAEDCSRIGVLRLTVLWSVAAPTFRAV
jgi:hypothetical protein